MFKFEEGNHNVFCFKASECQSWSLQREGNLTKCVPENQSSLYRFFDFRQRNLNKEFRKCAET